METGQLKRLIETVVDLSATLCAEGRVFNLKEFAAVLPEVASLRPRNSPPI